MKVLLISTTSDVFKAPPLGLLYIASVLEQDGHEVKLYDVNFDIDFSFNDVDMIGISCMTPTVNFALKLVDKVRTTDEDIPIVFGGPHPTVLPETMIRHENDFVVIGEGEATIRDFVSADFKKVSGMYGMGVRPHIKDLDLIPFPARHLLNREYFKAHRTSIMGSRGCPFNCSFCQPTLQAIFGDVVRYRSPRNIRKEVEHLQNDYGIKQVYFEDDTITINKRWLSQLCYELGWTGIAWECVSRVDTIDLDILSKMKASGCKVIRFGVESGSQKILDSLNKGITVEQTIKAFDSSHDIGIEPSALVMLGSFEESKETVKQTEELLSKIKPARLYISITTPLPKTKLWEDMVREGSLSLGSVPWEQYSYRDSPIIKLKDFTPEGISKVKGRLMRRFWLGKLLSPSFVASSLKTRSLSESFRIFKHLIGFGGLL